MSRNLGEIVVSLVFIILVVLKLDPFRWTMPDQIEMIVLALVVAAYAVYAGLFFRERAHDEREAYHLYVASRIAYLAGVGFLVVALVVQSFAHHLDPWLVGGLTAMVLVKMITLMWARLRR